MRLVIESENGLNKTKPLLLLLKLRYLEITKKNSFILRIWCLQKYDIKNIISLYSQLYFIILSSTLFLEIMEFRSSIICNLGDPSRVQIMVNQLPFPALPSNTSSGNKLPFSTRRTYTPLGNLLPFQTHYTHTSSVWQLPYSNSTNGGNL